MKIHLYLFICLVGGFAIGLLNGVNGNRKFKEPDCELPARKLCQPVADIDHDFGEYKNEMYSYTRHMPRYYDPECELLETDKEKKRCSESKLLEVVYDNLKFPQTACVNGMVVVSFVVTKEGRIQNLKIVRDIGGGAGEEALRVVKFLDQWVPGMQNGKPVDVQFNLPVLFKLEH